MKGNFNSIIHSSQPVLVDFYADWCQPCHVQSPVVQEIAREYGDKVKVIKINVDKNQEVSAQYRIQSIPTLIIFKDGQALWRHTGVAPKNTIKTVLEKMV